MIDYIDERDYSPELHPEHTVRVAQVRELESVFSSRPVPTVQWIFYAKSMPTWDLPNGIFLQNITESPAVKAGWMKSPISGDFVDPASKYREIFSDGEIRHYVRTLRNVRFMQCDPLIIRHMSQPENAKTLTEAQYAELQSYMQALRDFPANVDLDNIIWPPKPAFIL